MAFGMFAFVTPGDEYFAYGAMAGLVSAFIAGVLLYSLLHRDPSGDQASVPATLLVFFAIILLGGVFQALFDRGPRSATITAAEDLRAFGLSEAFFATLCQQQPDLAIKLLTALGRELSVRIRHANMTIQQLET